MSLYPARGSSRRPDAAQVGIAFVLATLVRTGLALSFPTIHGGDAAARLANADSLLLGYQLPLPQALVFMGKALFDDPLFVRLTFCVFGGILAAGLTALLSLAADSRSVILGSLLFSLDPLLLHYSIVPYQEPVAYGLLAWAFFFRATGRETLAAVMMAGACLSRYEAWLFLPVFLWAFRSRKVTWCAVLPVLGWILWWKGLAPRGLYVLDLGFRSSPLSRISFLGSKFIEYETPWVPLLAGIGAGLAVAGRHVAILKSVAALAAAIVVIVIFGHEYPAGSGRMSERLIHLPVLLALLLASFALGRLGARSRLAHALCLGATVLFTARNLRFEISLLRAAAREPDLALAREAARAIESNREPGECVSVLAPVVDAALLDAYVEKVRAASGDTERASERARELALSSPDRDRIAAHLRAETGTVWGRPGCPLLVLVDGIRKAPPLESEKPATLVAEISAGPRRARLLRIPR